MFDKIFMIKTLNKWRIEETFLNLIKYIFEKPTAKLIYIVERLKDFSQDQEQGKDVYPHH